MDQSSLTGFVSCLLISVASPFSAFSCDVSACGESSARATGLAERMRRNGSSQYAISPFIETLPPNAYRIQDHFTGTQDHIAKLCEFENGNARTFDRHSGNDGAL